MKAIFGLGNIGAKYVNTHHNVGFIMADAIAKEYGLEFTKKKFDAMVAEGNIGGEKVILVKPTTFMNLSGRSVVALTRKLKMPTKDVLVIYDDIDLPVGKVRFRESGSGGTHNGMKNIIEMTGTQEIPRLRVGVGMPEKGSLIDFVLAKISEEDMKKIEESKAEVLQKVQEFLSKNKF